MSNRWVLIGALGIGVSSSQHAVRQVADQNMAAACTNPAALGGGSGDLHAYLSTDGSTIVGTFPPSRGFHRNRRLKLPG